ncbi:MULTISPECIES: carbohydrate ABC transporter permease [unclassified Hahella]|uniref:carbohydrate ABC transporter permease n=1 Tax=unclassified Hahella TaxID=2624107 RepID=UPI001C1EC600|nr:MULTISPECIES: sugar ABC transporter permease [unclassified Hahella]MBU6955265.1 sugar ABC transporter permease [Hahella sp. HN01]MDG9672061.1 sugar ABC transporter permease [Hahella sp. CR1]
MLFRSRLQLLLLMSPATLLLAMLTLYPISQILINAFSYVDYVGAERQFVGLDNFVELSEDWFFAGAIKNSLSFSVLASLLQVGLGLALAVLFDRQFAGRRFALPVIIYPMMLSTLVCSAIWRAWYHYDFGFLNNALLSLGLEPVQWLFDPDMALFSVMLVDIWQWTPMAFLIILAGLQSIPADIKDAALTDGARGWRRFRHITLPLIMPQVLLALLLRSIDTFKLFDKVYALTGGGPGNSTETLSLFIYKQGFKFFNLGLASAAALLMLTIACALSAVYAWRYVGAKS